MGLRALDLSGELRELALSFHIAFPFIKRVRLFDLPYLGSVLYCEHKISLAGVCPVIKELVPKGPRETEDMPHACDAAMAD
jgi:hypothetical protein